MAPKMDVQTFFFGGHVLIFHFSGKLGEIWASLGKILAKTVLEVPCFEKNAIVAFGKARGAYAQSFALWQQAIIEFTCHDHSSRTLLLRSIVSITRAYTQARSQDLRFGGAEYIFRVAQFFFLLYF